MKRPMAASPDYKPELPPSKGYIGIDNDTVVVKWIFSLGNGSMQSGFERPLSRKRSAGDQV